MSWKLITVLCLLLLTAPAMALEVAGVPVPSTVTLADGEKLVLNGAGVRKKFFFKIYVGALYLPRQATSSSQVYVMPGSKRVLMHFVYDEVSAVKLVEGWSEGFENNLDAASRAALRPSIQSFNRLFETVRKGDEIRLDYIPGKGTEVWIRDALQGTIEGEDFFTALLKIWLGSDPADDGLKKAMLGG